MRNLALLLCLLPVGLPAQEAPLVLLGKGILCDGPEPHARTEAPGTIEGSIGQITQGVLGFDLLTDRVPLVEGLRFGLHLQLDGPAPVDRLMLRVLHPPMGSEAETEQSWETDAFEGRRWVSVYALEYDYELVPGQWRFEVLAGDTLLASEAFTLVEPALAPDAMRVCFGKDQLS